jgi:hypothetical protein
MPITMHTLSKRRDSVKATVSRRHVLAAAAVTMTPPATLAANGSMSTRFASVDETDQKLWPDPVFAAIERYRQAVQRWLAEDDDTRSAQLLKAADEARCA